MSTPAISPSSRSSGFVNDACTGPRRPRMTTSETWPAASGPSAWSAVSVTASSPGSSRSMRARSVATLPLPITTARCAERSNDSSTASGWPLYQATKRVAGIGARPVLARDPEPVVVGRAERVEDGVVAREQIGARDVLAERDAAEEPEARLARGLLVRACDGLDLRVVRSHARAHQPERRRQGVEQVDLEARAQQLVAGVEARRSSADHRNPHRVQGIRRRS